VIVVAPHPDDEVLGVGGTVALLAGAGAEVIAVAVTDGEASHPQRRAELRVTRPRESAAAAAVLGTTPSVTHRLGLPDGGVDAAYVADALASIVRPADLVIAPWILDGHPDHEAVGQGCSEAAEAAGATQLSYLVWAWHWAGPGELPWATAVRVELTPSLTDRKRRAVRCFASQLAGPEPILEDSTVDRLTRPFEVLLRR
jgi:LmbE family N-acetylglucosaminyl deacetylase